MIFPGTEHWVDMAVLAGANGTISGLANLLPREYSQIYKYTVSGKLEEARVLQEKAIRTFNIVHLPSGGSFTRAALGAFKVALWLMGIIQHYTLAAPFAVLSKEEVQQIHNELIRLDLLHTS